MWRSTVDIERQLDAKQSRRMKAEDRYLGRLESREADATAMVGELCRNGRTVHYVYPVGGRYREGSEGTLINFLIRNNYA
jgi:hypothetical protein